MRTSKHAYRAVSKRHQVVGGKAGGATVRGRQLQLLAAVAVSGISLIHGRSAQANSYLYDPANSGFGSDGSGPWDTTSSIWFNYTTTSDSAYSTNATSDIANFGAGTPGAYNIAVDPGGINVGQINFITSGYNVTGGALTLGSAAVINTSSGASSSIGSNLNGSGSLAITGGGTLTLTGSNTFGGTTSIGTTSGVTTTLNINSGALTPGGNGNGTGGFFIATTSGSTGVVNMTGGVASDNFYFSVGQNGYGTLNMSGGSITSAADFNVGNQATALGVLNLSGTASITQTGTAAGSNGIVIGQANGGQGIVNQVAGTVTQTKSGEYLQLASFSANSAGVWNLSGGSVSVTGQTFIGNDGFAGMYITGGTFTANNYVRVGGGFNTVLTNSTLDVSGGVFNQSNASQHLTVGELNNASLNIRGTGTVYAGNLYEGGSASESQGQTGIVNLLPGGSLVTGSIGYGGRGTTFFDFNGGTLSPTGSSTSFMGGLTAALVYSGGALIDTTNGNVTISQALLTPSGSGVSSVAVSGGPSYLEAPVVSFTGGGGNGASGVATINASGNVTGIIITNPGQGYTSAPTVSLNGVTLTGISNSSSYTTASTAADTSGGLTKLGPNTLTLSSSNSSFTGNVNISAGMITTGSGNGNGQGPLGATKTVSRTVTINNGATLNLAGGDVMGAGGGTSLVNVVVNSGGLFEVTVSGSGNSINNLNLNGGTLTTGNGYSVAYPTLTIGGTVTVAGSSASVINSTSSGSSNNIDLGFPGSTNSTTFNVADVTGSVAADLSISTPIGGTGGSGTTGGTLVKTGAGTLALSGSNIYTGGTNLSNGTMQANAARVLSGSTLTKSATGTGTASIYNGGVLAGNGGTGAVVVNSGGTITAGTGATTADTVGTLTTGAQTWNSNGTFVDKINSIATTGGNDELIMSGLAINATSVVGAQFNVSIASVSGGAQTLPAGSVVVLADDTEAAGSNPFNSTTSLAKLNLITSNITAPSGYGLQLATQADTTGNGGYDLVLQDILLPTSITYTGAVNGSFDTSTQNFVSSLGATAFTSGNTVLFDDSAVGTTNVTVTAGGVAPTELNFNNSSKSYTFGGGPITSGLVNITGGGTVTFNNANTYTGNTNISNGTFVVGSTGSITSPNVVVGSAGNFVMLTGGQATPFNLIDGGSASFNNPNQTLLALTGNGTVNLNGCALTVGTLTNFTGGFGGTGGSLNISAGTVAINGASGFNGLNGGITVGAGTLVVPNGSTTAGIVSGTPVTVTLAAGSTLQTPDGANTTFAGNINVTGTTDITAGPTNASSSTLNLTGSISGSVPVNFAGTGNSTVRLSGSNNYTGETRLSGDGSPNDSETLQLGATNGISPASGLAIIGTTTGHLTVDLNGYNQSVAYLGGVAGLNNSITTSTGGANLTISNGNNATGAASSSTPITGAITLTKTGTGNQQLLGNSSYTGGTTISAGTLTAGAANAFGTGPVTLNGGTLALGITGNSNVSGFSNFATNGGSNTSAGVLNLTADNGGIQQTSAFTATPQSLGNSGFVASFTYNASHTGAGVAGDGMAFVIQNDSRGNAALGGPGGALGYGNNGNGAITQIGNSGAVDFNLYFAYTPGTAFSTNGTVPATFGSSTPVNLNDGTPHQVTLTYNAAASTLNETIASNGSTYTTTFNNVNYANLLGASSGYVGFTGGTYAATAAQSISNFTFATFNAPLSIANAVVSTPGTTSTISFPVSASSTTAAIGSLNVASGSTVVISSVNSNSSAGRGVLVVPSLNVAGTLDIGTNNLDLNSNDLTSTTALVASGSNGGAFNGSGITSSAAQTDPTHLHAIGVISNNVSGSQLYGAGATLGLFDGANPGLNDTLVKYTYYGDANLSGVVDSADYALIDAGYLSNLTGWHNGDFNYDGVVNGSDYTLIDNAFNTQGSPQNASGDALLATATSQVAGVTAVPEPATAGLLVIGAVGVLGRRRRHR